MAAKTQTPVANQAQVATQSSKQRSLKGQFQAFERRLDGNKIWMAIPTLLLIALSIFVFVAGFPLFIKGQIILSGGVCLQLWIPLFLYYLLGRSDWAYSASMACWPFMGIGVMLIAAAIVLNGGPPKKRSSVDPPAPHANAVLLAQHGPLRLPVVMESP